MARKTVKQLLDADITQLALCKVGANRQRVFLLKTAEGEDDLRVAMVAQLVKEPGADWKTAYVPVAVPHAEEDPGILGDPDALDVWDEAEIEKAAHRFMQNGAKIVAKHFDSEAAPGVKLVENAVALNDFKVGATTIKKGTWYVGLQFDDEVRELVTKGEIDAVSVEGFANRVAKGALERVPGVQNWVDRVGGFPPGNWIYRAAKHLHFEKGMTIGHAIPVAVNAAKKLCATGDLNWPGFQQARADHRADACKGVAEWEAMKARAHAMSLAKEVAETEALVSLLDGGSLQVVEPPAPRFMQRVAKALGIPYEVAPLGDEDEYAVDPEMDEWPEDEVELAKAKLDAAARKRLPKASFVFPGKAPGSGSYPIHDRAHAANALARSSGKPEYARVRAAVCNRYKDMPACKGGRVAKEDTLSEDPGTVEDVELNERVEAVEKAVQGQGEQIAKLVGDGTDENPGAIAKLGFSIDTLAKRIPEPDPDAGKSKEEIVKELNGGLEKAVEQFTKVVEPLAKRLDALEEGESEQPDTERVAKRGSSEANSDVNPDLVGIL